jgi:Fe-S-cluster containining protein
MAGVDAEGLAGVAEDSLPAGDFSTWLVEIRGAVRGDHGAQVPCGGCTACCTSSQFVHIAPDETNTLAHVPAELLFPAPGLPEGHVLLGYDQRGHCPMLVDNRCSIYEHRPRTCRSYDCRVFPASGLEPDGADKARITQQVRRWRFSYEDEAGQVQHAAVRAAAVYLAAHPEVVPGGLPSNPTQRAVLAVLAHRAFVGSGADDDRPVCVTDPQPEAVRDELDR